MNTQAQHPNKHEYRIVVLGERGVGRTALINQFVYKRYLETYDPTIENSHQKHCTIDGQPSTLLISDTALREEEESSLSSSPLHQADGFILTFAINSHSSFEALPEIYQHIRQAKNMDYWPAILVGTKSDVEEEKRRVTREEAEGRAREWNAPYIEVAAKERHNIEEAFFWVVREIRKFRGEANGAVSSKNAKSDCIIS